MTAAATLGRRPVHGQLWLLDTGLLYRRLDLRTTAKQLRTERGRRAPAQTVDPGARPQRRFTGDELDRLVAAAPASRWVARSDLRSARLRRRPTVARLRLELVDGGHLLLSWPRREQATPAVEDHLRGWLGDELDA